MLWDNKIECVAWVARHVLNLRPTTLDSYWLVRTVQKSAERAEFADDFVKRGRDRSELERHTVGIGGSGKPTATNQGSAQKQSKTSVRVGDFSSS
jgi:hypothetical protein